MVEFARLYFEMKENILGGHKFLLLISYYY